MLNQFHDILPGTTVSLVVDDVLEIYERRGKQLESLIQDAIIALYPDSYAISDATEQPNDMIIVLDPLRLHRDERHLINGQLHQLDSKRTGSNRTTSGSAISGGSQIIPRWRQLHPGKSGFPSHAIERQNLFSNRQASRAGAYTAQPWRRERWIDTVRRLSSGMGMRGIWRSTTSNRAIMSNLSEWRRARLLMRLL